ncbi:MAG: hypothetical protein FD123_66 [Bacteroidetes bacterium]|nr:MAG: hypothetical protein FD123_66 [Bacteroidota bacterium]
MKPIPFCILIFCLAACSSDSEHLSSGKNLKGQQKDSIDYIITENFTFWQSVRTPAGDTTEVYLREILFKNETKRPVYLPILVQTVSDYSVYCPDHSLDNRIIAGHATHHYVLSPNSDKAGRWAMNVDFNASSQRHKLKAGTEESFYLVTAKHDETRLPADSFVFRIDYWLDSLPGKQGRMIIKNLYTSGKKLIEVSKFVSLER